MNAAFGGVTRFTSASVSVCFLSPFSESCATWVRQEPITWSLHLPYKPLESALSDEQLFIEIAIAEHFSRLLINIQSEQSYAHTPHAESQKRDLNCCQQWRYPALKSYLMIILIFCRVKNIRLRPNNKKKKVIQSCDVFKFTCNLDGWLHIISFITNHPVPALESW